MRRWTSGYTQTEFDVAQERFGLRFPPDLAALLLERRPLHGYDWRADDDSIERALDDPLDGLLFDVEHEPVRPDLRRIPFWSDLVKRNVMAR